MQNYGLAPCSGIDQNSGEQNQVKHNVISDQRIDGVVVVCESLEQRDCPMERNATSAYPRQLFAEDKPPLIHCMSSKTRYIIFIKQQLQIVSGWADR